MDGSGDTVVKYEKNGEIEEIKAKTVLVTALRMVEDLKEDV